MSTSEAAKVERGDLKSTSYEFFILAMAILSIANLPLLFLFSYQSQPWYLVLFVEGVLTFAFLIDFVYRLRTAPSKRGYFFHEQGFLDLLSCVPGLRIFRIFRVVRAVRIVRRLGGPRVLGELRQQLSSGAVYLVIFVLITVLEVVGLLELHFEENAPGANITTAGDALWWGYVTADDRRLRRQVPDHDRRPALRRDHADGRRRGLRNLLRLYRHHLAGTEKATGVRGTDVGGPADGASRQAGRDGRRDSCEARAAQDDAGGEPRPMNEDSTRVELLAIPLIVVIFGIGALVMFAAVEGPWAWIVLGIGLLILLALVIRYVTKRYPHMWDEAPPDDLPQGRDDIS